jgi:hypothetical protein
MSPDHSLGSFQVQSDGQLARRVFIATEDEPDLPAFVIGVTIFPLKPAETGY